MVKNLFSKLYEDTLTGFEHVICYFTQSLKHGAIVSVQSLSGIAYHMGQHGALIVALQQQGPQFHSELRLARSECVFV